MKREIEFQMNYNQSIFSLKFLGNQVMKDWDLLPLKKGYAAYKPKVNPQTLAEYTFAAGRAGHSLIKGVVKYVIALIEMFKKFYNKRIYEIL